MLIMKVIFKIIEINNNQNIGQFLTGGEIFEYAILICNDRKLLVYRDKTLYAYTIGQISLYCNDRYPFTRPNK